MIGTEVVAPTLSAVELDDDSAGLTVGPLLGPDMLGAAAGMLDDGAEVGLLVGCLFGLSVGGCDMAVAGERLGQNPHAMGQNSAPASQRQIPADRRYAQFA